MSNVLKVSHQEAIRSLHEKGWSQRRIARELGINGRTVRRYIRGGVKMHHHFDPRLKGGIGLKVHQSFRPPARRVWLGGNRGFRLRTFGPQEPVRAL